MSGAADNDYVANVLTQGVFATCSTISAVRFGIEGALGLQNGELPVIERTALR